MVMNLFIALVIAVTSRLVRQRSTGRARSAAARDGCARSPAGQLRHRRTGSALHHGFWRAGPDGQVPRRERRLFHVPASGARAGRHPDAEGSADLADEPLVERLSSQPAGSRRDRPVQEPARIRQRRRAHARANHDERLQHDPARSPRSCRITDGGCEQRGHHRASAAAWSVAGRAAPREPSRPGTRTRGRGRRPA